jgi:type IV pilus assembly protein PilV
MDVSKTNIVALTKNSAGFTLIEVLISITVFAIGILAVITMQTSGVLGNAKAQTISEAVNQAAEQVETLLNTSYSSITDGAGTNAGQAGLDDGLSVTTADGSAVSGNYNIYWNVWDGAPATNCKTIRVIVVNNQLQAPVKMNFVKVKDL